MNKETVVYKQAGNCRIQADIYPAEAKGSPVIMFIHGGALIWGSRQNIFPEQVELYHRAGFGVIAIDYRLAPETKLELIIEDVRDAIGWIRNRAGIDYDLNPERLAVVGSSAGGYLGLLSGTFEDKPEAIVSFYGYGDITADWFAEPSPFYCQRAPVSKERAYRSIQNEAVAEGNRDRFYYYLYCRQTGRWVPEVSGYDPGNERDKLQEFCPQYKVTKGFPPALLLHGDEDNDIPYSESINMARKLEDMGIENKLIILKGQGHVFDRDLKDKQVREAFDEVLSFLREHMG